MKTIKQIKDKYAREHGYDDFHSMFNINQEVTERDINELMIRCAKTLREEVVRKVRVKKNGNSGSYLDAVVDKESITNIKLE